MIKKILKKFFGAKKEPVKKLDNEYLKWLSFANAGMLDPGNIYSFDYIIKNLPSDNPIIEIGSFCGLSTNTMSYFLEKHKKKNNIMTSDKWIFEGSENGGSIADSNISYPDYKTFVIDSFKRNVKFFSKSNLPFSIEVFSDEFFELWQNKATVKDIFNREIKLGGGISFAYIDGNHTYDFAKRDFENTAKFLDIGGFILFDDSSDKSSFGCGPKLMNEILENKDFELVFKNPNYLFRKIR